MYAIPTILGAVIPGSQLQGIQTGTCTILDGSSSNTAAIAAVTLNKSFIVFQYESEMDTPNAGYHFVRGRISSTTQLTFSRNDSVGAGDIYIRWWVVEFQATSSVTVQRNSTTLTGAINNVTISAVNLSNSFPIISYQTPDSNTDEDHFITADLTSTTNLRLQVNASRSQIVDWEVIENPSWTVAKYTDTITGLTKDTTITAVTLANTFLISTGRFSGSALLGGDALFRSGFTSTTNIRATRNASPLNSPIVYFVVSSTRIGAQHVQYGITAPATSNTQAISAITVANSFIKMTGMNVSHSLNASSSDNGGRICVKHSINSTIQIQADRQVGTDTINFNCSVMDFTSV